MNRLLHASVVLLTAAGIAFAQPPAPAGAPPLGAPPQGAPGQGVPGGPGGRGGGGRGFAPIPTGPSAPVPPQVAIPRPTPQEIDQVNALVKKWVDSNKGADKALLQKMLPLLTVKPVRLNVAATVTNSSVRGPRHDAFVEIAKQGGPIDLLLEGDSITDWWTQGPEKKAVFDKYFGAWKTANFAVAGDTTNGVLWGLRNGEGQGIQPKTIMLMIGTNNTGSTNTENSASAEAIAEGVGADVLELRTDFPNAKILLLAIFPRGVPDEPVREKINQINKLISKLDDGKNIFYMDIGPKFLDAKGAFLEGTFQADNLHPAPAGYEIWGAAVKDKLTELMK
jgi:lysophospholipase L1-like esterase